MNIDQRFNEFLAYAVSNPNMFVLNNTHIVLTEAGVGPKCVELIDAGASSVSVRIDSIDTSKSVHFIAWANQVCGC